MTQHIQGCGNIVVKNNVCDIMYSIMDYRDTKNYMTDNPKRNQCRITATSLEFYVSHCSPLHLKRKIASLAHFLPLMINSINKINENWLFHG